VKKKTLCFIPVYNQIKELPTVLKELKAANLPIDTILLVNNGSNDGSEKLVRSSGYPYLDLPQNRGIGYSFMKATEWAIKDGFDIFTVIASNGKMLPAEMHRVVQPVAEGKADYVTGSRFLQGGDSPNLPKFRKTSIPIVNKFVWILTGARITDATCGYKAYNLDIFKRANFDWNAPWLETYGFEYYLYSKVIQDKQISWMEVPITMRYPQKGQKYSKMKPFISWWHMLKPWIIGRLDGKGFSPHQDKLEQAAAISGPNKTTC